MHAASRHVTPTLMSLLKDGIWGLIIASVLEVVLGEKVVLRFTHT